jgi:hypothetical protein
MRPGADNSGRKAAVAAEAEAMDEFVPCAVCMRTPLVGEEFTVIAGGGYEELVCDLCLAKPRAAALGEPLRRGRVRTTAGAENVQRIYPRPVPARADEGAPATAPAG